MTPQQQAEAEAVLSAYLDAPPAGQLSEKTRTAACVRRLQEVLGLDLVGWARERGLARELCDPRQVHVKLDVVAEWLTLTRAVRHGLPVVRESQSRRVRMPEAQRPLRNYGGHLRQLEEP